MTKYLCLSALLFVAPLSFGAETVRYSIYTQNDHKSGEQVVETGADGQVKVQFAFKDNGRGPDLKEQFRLNKDGVMSEYTVDGTSTFGSIAHEHFALKQGHAVWESSFDKGDKAVSGPALYVPVNGSYAMNSISLAALIKRGGRPLPLVPSGTLTQKHLLDVTLKGGKKVQLLSQTGLGLSPNLMWATTGSSPRLFAYIQPGFMTIIEDGWLPAAKLLEEKQKIADGQLLADLATHTLHPLTGLTVIRDARVFDSERAQLTAPSDVYVQRGRITAVVPKGTPTAGADAEIDAGGRVLSPGLYDMHAHFDRWSGALHLSCGVTTIRDMGNNNEQMQQMIDEQAAGKILAPRMVTAGFLEGESPFSANLGFVVKDLEGAKHAIDWYNEHGYPQLKIYNSFPHALVRDTVAYAHSRGMRVSGHVPAFMRAQEVVEQGFDEIQHINQVLLNFLVKPDTDTRTLARFYLPAEKLADFDFDSRQVKDFLALLKKHQTVIDSTVGGFSFIEHRDGELDPTFAAVADHMPPDVKRSFYSSMMKIPDDQTAARYKKSYDKMIEFVGRMYKAGIPLVAGTDSLPGFTLQRELETYVMAGLTPAQALQVAIFNGAKYTRTGADRGTVAPGKSADLVVFDGDPTHDISDIRKVALVIQRDKLIYPNEIDKALGIVPFVENPPALKRLH